MQDVTEPSDLVSHAEPGPWCYRRKVHSLLYFFLQQEERNPASHTEQYSPDLSALEPDRLRFDSWFCHLFAL